MTGLEVAAGVAIASILNAVQAMLFFKAHGEVRSECRAIFWVSGWLTAFLSMIGALLSANNDSHPFLSAYLGCVIPSIVAIPAVATLATHAICFVGTPIFRLAEACEKLVLGNQAVDGNVKALSESTGPAAVSSGMPQLPASPDAVKQIVSMSARLEQLSEQVKEKPLAGKETDVADVSLLKVRKIEQHLAAQLDKSTL